MIKYVHRIVMLIEDAFCFSMTPDQAGVHNTDTASKIFFDHYCSICFREVKLECFDIECSLGCHKFFYH